MGVADFQSLPVPAENSGRDADGDRQDTHSTALIRRLFVASAATRALLNHLSTDGRERLP